MAAFIMTLRSDVCMMHIYRRGSMRTRNTVQNTHISAQLRALHTSLLEIVSAMNRPRRDELLIKKAGIALDRARCPRRGGGGRGGPSGGGERAGRAGRGD